MKFEAPVPAVPRKRVETSENTTLDKLGERIAQEEVRRNTNEIEWRLENGFPELRLDEKRGRKRLHPGNWLRTLLAAGMLLGGTGTKAETGGSAASPKKGAPVPVLVSGVTERKAETSHEAARQELIKKTGLDMMSIAEKAGFTARLDVDNGEGPYIVHIGQSHLQKEATKVLSPEDQAQIEKQIIAAQIGIEQVLLALFESSGGSVTNIFIEGMEANGQTRTEFKAYRETLSKILPRKGCFIEVLDSYKSINQANADQDNPQLIALTYLHRQKLKELKEHFLAHPHEYQPLQNAVATPERISERKLTPKEAEFEADKKVMNAGLKELRDAGALVQELIPGGTKATGSKTETLDDLPGHSNFATMEQELEFVQKSITNKYDTFGQYGIYMAGAAYKLAVERNILLAGTEDAAVNRAAMKALEKMAAHAAPFIKRLQNPTEAIKVTEEEQRTFFTEHEILMADMERIAIHDREDVVLRIIGQKNAASAQRIFVTVFGRMHKFPRATLEHNIRNPDNKFGVVTLVPENIEK
ncbi:MAG TPA: hypothetical protein VK675_01580 [Candidatus Paceibacterota bacterium]|nr:hypothetical protein [Candidatus Paceibacterota bacterium]